MADVVADDVLRVDCVLEYDGSDDIVNVYQFQVFNIVDPTPASVIEDLLEFIDALYDVVDALMSNDVLFKLIKIVNLTQDLLYGSFDWPTLTAGGDATDLLPQAVSGLISWPTGVPRVVLRKYLGMFCEDVIDGDGRWNSTALTAFGNFGVSLTTIIDKTAADFEYGYLSPKTSTWVAPTTWTVTDVPAYQRRRKPGVGS